MIFNIRKLSRDFPGGPVVMNVCIRIRSRTAGSHTPALQMVVATRKKVHTLEGRQSFPETKLF